MWGRGVDNIEKSSQAKKSLVFQLLSHVQLFVTPWTVAHQAPLFLGLPRQEYWNGLPFPSPVDHPNLGIQFTPPILGDKFFTAEPTGKSQEESCGHGKSILVNQWHVSGNKGGDQFATVIQQLFCIKKSAHIYILPFHCIFVYNMTLNHGIRDLHIIEHIYVYNLYFLLPFDNAEHS